MFWGPPGFKTVKWYREHLPIHNKCIQMYEGSVADFHPSPQRPLQDSVPPIRKPPQGGCCLLASTAIKRSRFGEPISAAQTCQSCPSRFSLDNASACVSDESFSDTNSDSDPDTQDDESLHEDSYDDERGMDLDHEFQDLIPDLVDSWFEKIQNWLASARFVVPPQDRLPPRKRVKTSNARPRSSYFEHSDERDQHLVIVSRVDGYFHLACPFYASNPERYRSCLLQHDFQCIEEVINHLGQQHAQPPYCPTCWETFNTTIDCNRHVRAMKCTFRPKPKIDGVGETQKAKLEKNDKLYLSEKSRWLRIWSTIYPSVKPHRSPYLEYGIERTVCMVRDFWAKCGMEWASMRLERNGILHQREWDEHKAHSALCRLGLQYLLHKLEVGQWPAKEGDGDSEEGTRPGNAKLQRGNLAG